MVSWQQSGEKLRPEEQPQGVGGSRWWSRVEGRSTPSCARIHGTDPATTNSAWSARQEERETAGGQAAPTPSNVSDARTTAPTMCQRSRRTTTTKGRAKARSECLARPSTTANQGTRATQEGWTMPVIGGESEDKCDVATQPAVPRSVGGLLLHDGDLHPL